MAQPAVATPVNLVVIAGWMKSCNRIASARIMPKAIVVNIPSHAS